MESILTWAFNHPYWFAIGIFSFFFSVFGVTALWLYRNEFKNWLKYRNQKQQGATQLEPKPLAQSKAKDKPKPAASGERKESFVSVIFVKLGKILKSLGAFISAQWKRLCLFAVVLKNKMLQILPKKSQETDQPKPSKISQKPVASNQAKQEKIKTKEEKTKEAPNPWVQKIKPVYKAIINFIMKTFSFVKAIIIKIVISSKGYIAKFRQKLVLKYQSVKKNKSVNKSSKPKKQERAPEPLSKEDILAAFAKSDQTENEEENLQIPVAQDEEKTSEEAFKPEEEVKEQDYEVEDEEQEQEPLRKPEVVNLLDGSVPLSLSQEVTFTQKRPPYKFTYLDGTFHKTYKNWALALSSPYLMAFQRPIDQLAFETQTLLKIERITNRVELFNRLEKLRVGFVRHEHSKLTKRVLELDPEDRIKFLHKQQGHNAYAKFQYIAKYPKLYQKVDYLVFDTILAVSLVREACSSDVLMLTEEEAKMLLYRLVYPLYQKAYDWSEISEYFRAGLHLYYAKSTRLTKRLSENLDELLENPQSPWIKLDDMNYYLDKSEYKITPPVLSEQQFDLYLSDWFRDFYGSQTTYQEAFYMVRKASTVLDFCSFVNSFSYGVEYLSYSALKPIADNLGLYEHELRAFAAGFILLGSDYVKNLMVDPDYALTSAADHLLYCKGEVVLPYVCFGLCCDSLGQSIQHLFELSNQEGQNLFGLNITLEELEEVKLQALKLSESYSSDWNDYPQFTNWLHYKMQDA